MKVRRVLNCLFEDADRQELVYAWYEDLDGYIIFEYCNDLTQQKQTLTKTQFYTLYERIW